MKFKVGDKVKVIAKKHGHHFNIGEIVKIEHTSEYDYICKSLKNNDYWNLGDDEIVKVKFTKADLKDGDKCTLRNGQVVFVDKTSNYSFESIDEQLSYFNDDVSIVKVERPVKYETVFERKEEILDEVEKRYLASVIKPFRHNVEYIKKFVYSSGIKQIKINVEGTIVNLPEFKNDMYKGMTPDRKYSLKELGL